MKKFTNILQENKKESEKKILNFPNHRQSTNYTCADAVVQTIFEYYGADYREMDIAKQLGSLPKEGTHVDKVEKFINKHGLETDVKEKMTINDLIKYIDKNIPVMILIQAWGEKKDYKNVWNCGHYTAVIGYDDENIYFGEPSLYTIGAIKKSELIDRWHDKDEVRKYINFGIAVYGKKPTFDKDKINKIE